MKGRRFILAVYFFASLSLLHAQGIIESAQQTLKDKGFYYGELTGHKDAGTIAAIRRYQIRNGLAINGELDADTQRSLGLIGGQSAQATPTASPASNSANSGERSRQSGTEPLSPSTAPVEPNSPERVPASEPRNVQPEASGIFDGTPYESAPPGLRQQTIMEAQEVLARGGYYRAEIDGAYGPGTEFALRAFQAQKGLPVTGRLDKPTLAALGLLPGQHPRTRRRLPPRPFSRPVYRGEWIPE